MSTPLRLAPRRFGMLLLAAQVLLGWVAAADAAPVKARFSVSKPVRTGAGTQSVPGCPDQGGLLDSITVPVDQPLDISVVIPSPAPAGGVAFNVKSDDPSIVAAGDRRQGFIPTVTIPEGATESNAFTIYGIAVGQTRLELLPLNPGYLPNSFPLGAWDINQSGSGSDQKFVDANAPVNACRADSGQLSNTPSVQASCGQPVKGVASDGVNALLLRTVSGLAGTACFEIVSSASLDQGTVQTPLIGTTPVASLNYGLSYYTPPAYYGDQTPSRTVTVEFSFTPNIGNGNTSTIQAPLEIIRPPVVLVHGLWSNPASWNNGYVLNDPLHTTVPADYAATNAASFSTNASAVKTSAAQAVTNARKKGYAATQVDVVGHSMGGLLTRLYVGAANYSRPDNLTKGDVHRLVTLDTPHFGSSFANLLVSLHNVDAKTAAKIETTVTTLTKGGNILGGAVCDLSENSPALQPLGGGTPVTSQVISASGGPPGTPAVPARYWGGATFLGLNSFESALTETYCTQWVSDPGTGGPMCTSTAPYFPQSTVDAFRFQELNDAVVTQSSQRGGLAGIDYSAYIHFHIPGIPGVQRGITDGPDVTTRTLQLLYASNDTLPASLPGVPSDGLGHPRVGGTSHDPQDYAAQCAPGGPMKPNATRRVVAAADGRAPRAPQAPDPRVHIVSPAAGTAYAQGQTISVVVELSPPLTAGNTVGVTFAGLKHVQATWTDGLHFTASLPASPLVSGGLTLTPDFTDTQGNFFQGAPVVVAVKPASAPVALSLVQQTFIEPPTTASRQLYVNGTLSDGSQVDLSSGLTGTTYASNNASVATVNSNGLVTIVGTGSANITATYGGLSAVATFLVEDPAHPPAAVDLTGKLSLTRGGLRLDRNSGLYLQDVTVKNTSSQTVPAVLYLVLSNLTPGVALVNKSGLTHQVAPLSSPYIRMTLPGDGLTLAPGASLTYTLQFLNQERSTIAYALGVLQSATPP